jgi:hypothetical protein
MYVCMLYIIYFTQLYVISVLAGYIQDIYWNCQTGSSYRCIWRITNSLRTALRFTPGHKYFAVYDFKLPPRSRWETALFWIITQRVVVISYRCFGTTYRSHLQGSRIQKRSWLLKMGPIRYAERSLRNCHYLLRNNSEERGSHCIICPKIIKFGGLHTDPPRRYPYFDVVEGFACSHEPESYAGGSSCYW